MIFGSHTQTNSVDAQEFSQTELPQTTISSSSGSFSKIIALLIVLGGGYLAYEVVLQEKKLADILAPLIGKNQDNIAVSVVTKIDAMLSSILGSNTTNTNVLPLEEIPSIVAPATQLEQIVDTQPEQDMQPVAQPMVVDIQHDNQATQDGDSYVLESMPYQNLSNGIDGEVLPTGRTISVQEEEVWRGGLTHRYVYQRQKTVEDIINERLSGSESLLETALLSRKFWTRMTALFGLVKLGSFVSPEIVDLAIADARESLVANYFKRFLQETAVHERYVLRYALLYVNARARLVILAALLNTQDKWTAEYMNAALNDPDPRIVAWANDNIHRLQEMIDYPTEQVSDGQIDDSMPVDEPSSPVDQPSS